MDRGTALLQSLRGQLSGWLEPIKRATYASRVEFLPSAADGAFSILVEWQTKEGVASSYSYELTRKGVFGASYGGSPLAYRIQRRACDHARDVIRAVLSARGAL